MLDLCTKTRSHIPKRHTTRCGIHGADSTEVALFRFYATTKLKPASFVHCLGKQDFRLNTFSIRFLKYYLAKVINSCCAFGGINSRIDMSS